MQLMSAMEDEDLPGILLHQMTFCGQAATSDLGLADIMPKQLS